MNILINEYPEIPLSEVEEAYSSANFAVTISTDGVYSNEDILKIARVYLDDRRYKS